MAEGDRSIAAVLADIVGDIQQIIRAEVRLAKVEVREEVGKAKRGATLLAVGAVTITLGMAFMLLAAVYALAMVWPPWAAALTVAVGSLVLGASVIAAGAKQMKDVNLAPPRTVATLQENIQWAKPRTK